MAAARASHKPVEMPFTDCCKPAIFSVKMQLAVDTVPAHGLGIISTLQVDNYRLAVNGSTLFARGTVEPGAVTFDKQRTFLTRIPAGVLRPGMNDLHYITVRDGFPYTDIYPPIIADYDALEAYSARRLFFMNEYYALCAAVLGMLGLLAAIMTFPVRTTGAFPPGSARSRRASSPIWSTPCGRAPHSAARGGCSCFSRSNCSCRPPSRVSSTAGRGGRCAGRSWGRSRSMR